eukprot:9480011-Pyramimonas_sp.AAC.1
MPPQEGPGRYPKKACWCRGVPSSRPSSPPPAARRLVLANFEACFDEAVRPPPSASPLSSTLWIPFLSLSVGGPLFHWGVGGRVGCVKQRGGEFLHGASPEHNKTGER